MIYFRAKVIWKRLIQDWDQNRNLLFKKKIKFLNHGKIGFKRCLGFFLNLNHSLYVKKVVHMNKGWKLAAEVNIARTQNSSKRVNSVLKIEAVSTRFKNCKRFLEEF